MATLSGPVRGNLLRRPAGEKVTITKQQFAQWLATADADGDGKVSWSELRRALVSLGLENTWWEASRALMKADLNDNNAIDSDSEFMILTKFAATNWGFIVTDDE